MAELERSKEAAVNANQAKSTFLAQMSHEIRTPINVVLGMNEMILRESTEESVRKYAENAYNAGNALLSIINDILDISKIEAGKMAIVEADYDLSSLVSDCYLMTADRAKKKGLELTVDCDENLPAKLGGDMFHIRQIAVNFLTNAVKYTDKGSVKLSFSGEKRDGEFFLRISVKDTGIGLTEESREKLFESVYGQGSEFICTIPQRIVNESPIGKINPERTANKLSTEKEKILTALGYCNGSEDFYAELLRDFAASNKLSALDEAFSKKDFEGYERIIHTLKGLARTLGFNSFSDIAEGLQKAATEQDGQYMEENHGKAVDMLSRIINCAEKL